MIIIASNDDGDTVSNYEVCICVSLLWQKILNFCTTFLLGEHGSTFAKQAAVSAAGCLTVSCLFELVLFSKKKM